MTSFIRDFMKILSAHGHKLNGVLYIFYILLYIRLNSSSFSSFIFNQRPCTTFIFTMKYDLYFCTIKIIELHGLYVNMPQGIIIIHPRLLL